VKLSRMGRLAVLALAMILLPAVSSAAVEISVAFAPPMLPVYEQPLCPEAGWIWTPGYWGYGDGGYYWIPGAWEAPPFVGALWTPPYWGWSSGQYVLYPGYWGTTVGFYGGVDYGFGYMGVGYVGGMWQGGVFSYNTAVTRVNRQIIHNTYVNNAIVRQNTIANINRVAYNGGPGGVRHSPTAAERQAMSQRHTPPTEFQERQAQQARADRASYAKVNGGHPRTLAVAHPQTTEKTAGAKAATRPVTRSEAGSRSEAKRRTTAEARGVTRSSGAAGARQETRGAEANGTARGSARIASAEKEKTEGYAPNSTRSQHETRPVTATHEGATSRRERTTHETPRAETHSTESARMEGSTHEAPRSERHVTPATPAVRESTPAIVSRPENKPHSEPNMRAETHPAPAVREPSREPAPTRARVPAVHDAPASHAAPAGHKPNEK